MPTLTRKRTGKTNLSFRGIRADVWRQFRAIAITHSVKTADLLNAVLSSFIEETVHIGFDPKLVERTRGKP